MDANAEVEVKMGSNVSSARKSNEVLLPGVKILLLFVPEKVVLANPLSQ